MSNNSSEGRSLELVMEVCRELVTLAKREADAADNEASRTHYWEPCPSSVVGHRVAARALREEASRLERQARCLPSAS